MNSQGPNIQIWASLGWDIRRGKAAEWVNERHQISFTKYSSGCKYSEDFAISFESDSKRNQG